MLRFPAEEASGVRLRAASAHGAGLLIAPRSMMLLGIPPSASEGRVLDTLTVPLLLLR